MGCVILEELVNIKDLVISYNDRKTFAVDRLSFTVYSGEVLGILGSNGAGKTSTMRCLSGITPPTSGIIHIAGYDLSNPAGSDAARSILGYCPDTGGLIRQATPREHIALNLGVRNKLSSWFYALELIERFGLGPVLDTETMGFSHGMSRRLSVLLAVLASEKVLILDEPFDGVDPIGVEVTIDLIRKAKEEGLAVIISTHLLSLLSDVSDRICVMNSGKMVADDLALKFKGEEGRLKYAALLKAM